ncbi:RagB/SusD family nutrient uptake outer membrane protein [Flavobacterium sp.]|uniref:RagB/SusD family nutrient uptake outer membrane protein n=1 Tax=Flavobacterium sp. TaxID=239 RepID=UPI002B67E97F|nr:RagB/SusD family nutrient uptake outer membrane protein [Flavobacterium sp.]HSD08477.1 RagB/SusD family nutrient uptake outer membrane protein [Flavobacterium sp.]
MKKNNIIKIANLFLAFAILISSSCSESFLKDEKTDGIDGDIVFSNDETATAAITGIYDTFQGEKSAEYDTKALFYPANFLSQDLLNVGADTFFQRYEIPATFGPFNALWESHYIGIGRANMALEKLPTAIEDGKVSAELGGRLQAECLALRAIFYTILAENFGGVPIVIEPANGKNDYAPRNSQDEVFAQVAKDMEVAVTKLPWTYDALNKGRATKGTAYAYLGNAYMWLKQYDKAAKAYEALEGHAELEANFLDIHAAANRNGKESLFELQFNDALGDLSWGRDDNVTFLQSFCMPAEIGKGGGYAASTKILHDSFEPGDSRKAATVIGPGETHPDPLIKISNYENIIANYGGMNTCGTVDAPWYGPGETASSGRTGYYNVKAWRDPKVEGWSYPHLFGGQNLIIMRYGEVLISQAECYHKMGDDAKAMQYLMKIRNRAGLTTQPTAAMDDAILNEYRHELAGEFSLWFLLRRSGNHVKYIKDRFNITIPAGHDLVPIPQNALDVNHNLKQNPGY